MGKEVEKALSVSLDTLQHIPPDELKELFVKFVKNLEKEGYKRLDKDHIPISIFNDKLSSLESIVKYLREDWNLSYKEIAKKISRKEGPIGVMYRKALKKYPNRLDISSDVIIPLNIFNKKLTIFESVVLYLKNIGYGFSQMADVLHRNYRTVWTVYNRAKKKNKGVGK